MLRLLVTVRFLSSPKFSKLLLSLDRIQGAAAYLLLMVLFEYKAKLQLEDVHLEQTVRIPYCFLCPS